jgi:hypothetical protein
MANNAIGQEINDSNIKKNVATIDQPLSKLAQLQPKTFEYAKNNYNGLNLPKGKQYGFMAENVEDVFPNMVQYQNYSYSIGKNMFRTAKVKNVDTESLIPVLVAAMQEMQGEIDKLKAEVEQLKKK